MSAIIIPSKRPWLRQPDRMVGIHPDYRAKKIIAAFLPSLGPIDIVNANHFGRRNNPQIGVADSGRTLLSTTAGTGYVGWQAPQSTAGSRSSSLYDVTAPPLTLVTIACANQNNGHALVRGNGSGNPSYAAGAWYGSSSGGEGYIRTTGGTLQLTPSSFFFDPRAVFAVTVFSVGPTSTQLWCGKLGGSILQRSSGATPTGNIYYEYGDEYRAMSVGANYHGFATATAGAAAFASEFSECDAAEAIANPWGIFKARRRISYFDLGAGAGSTLNGSATGAAVAAGAATLAAQVALSAVGVSSAAGSAAGSVNVPLSATGIAVSTGAATASAAVTISASALAQAAGSAGLSASVLLAGAGAAQASGNAALAVQLSALAAGAAQASGSANLSGGAPGALSANGSAVADGQAVLSVSVNLAAAGNAVASGTANGSANAPGGLSAAGAAHADGWASWSVLTTLTAAGFVQAMGAGQLAISVPLSAAGQASASGSAAAALLGQVRNFRLAAGAPQRVTRAHCAAQRTTRLKHEAIHA